ncbi:MAG: sulfotransferase domain-containing protein [Immundisolibacteraceae bacterium]|nr:sulfotransferase domain-containing protein [Immundisolibacteraceae bacterium]
MAEPKLSRPRSMEEMMQRVSGLITEASIGNAMSFQLRPSDVFINTYPKSGTTWLQQIVHGLRSRGDMDFDEITAVVPWMETALDMGIDIHGEQFANPRAYKMHLPLTMAPKGGKTTTVVRDPKDVVVSQYHFWNGWFFEEGTVTTSEIVDVMFVPRMGPINYWDHLLGWWPERDSENLLVLCYEQMKQDFPATLERIAKFIGCELDDELREIVLRQSSIEFMRDHNRQFDDHLFSDARNEACGLPPGETTKVRRGAVGDHNAEMTTEAAEKVDQAWQREITPETGLASYADLQAYLSE